MIGASPVPVGRRRLERCATLSIENLSGSQLQQQGHPNNIYLGPVPEIGKRTALAGLTCRAGAAPDPVLACRRRAPAEGKMHLQGGRLEYHRRMVHHSRFTSSTWPRRVRSSPSPWHFRRSGHSPALRLRRQPRPDKMVGAAAQTFFRRRMATVRDVTEMAPSFFSHSCQAAHRRRLEDAQPASRPRQRPRHSSSTRRKQETIACGIEGGRSAAFRISFVAIHSPASFIAEGAEDTGEADGHESTLAIRPIDRSPGLYCGSLPPRGGKSQVATEQELPPVAPAARLDDERGTAAESS